MSLEPRERILSDERERMMGTAASRLAIKKVASSFGLEIMTREGRRNIDREYQGVIGEYLGLLCDKRGITLAPNAQRVAMMSNLVGTKVGEASHILACLAATRDVAGDVCECGVGSGATSALLANELRDTGKRLWLYDTFNGLPAPSKEDLLIDDIDNLGSMAAYQGRMSHPRTEVESRLAVIGIPSSAIRIVPGLFEDSVAAGALPERVSFAYVDFDFYAPIKLALEVLSDRLSPGGNIIVDDYGFFSEGAQTAVDNYLTEHPGRFDLEVPSYCRDRFAILKRKG